MSNQDFEGNAPADEPSGSAGAPASLEQQLEKEREARMSMRDRLRHTEALAAESHALRARMAQELERVTADRDRLRTAAANSPAAAAPAASARPSTSAEPPAYTPRMASPDIDLPLQPPMSPARSGPWRALAMLGGLAAGVACLAWITGTLPGEPRSDVAAASAAKPSIAASTVATARPAPSAPPVALAATTTTTTPATAVPPSPGAIALAPQTLTPEQQLAAAPTAAGPAPAPASGDMPARLRKALDGEGIVSPVEVDATTGHVVVADPQADAAARDRTDLVIRAVFAGASLPEPQIEHRWLSPRRGDHAAPTAAEPVPVAKPEQTSGLSPAEAYAARHAAPDHHKKSVGPTVADAEELRPVLPEGRVTASCRASLAGKSTPHRADMTACMKHSCCATASNRQAEDCRAYEKSYPFACSAG